jgi:Protein of unknown function (DUF3500)
MTEHETNPCPECESPDGLGRRDFLMAVGGTAVTLAGLEAGPQILKAQGPAAQPAAAPRAARPAEALIRELYQGLTDEQRRRVVYPWDHTTTVRNERHTTRLGMYNSPIFSNHTIRAVYTRPQQELNERILRAISSDEEGYRRVTRNGTFDASGAFASCGAYIFGDPTNNQQFSWVFAGHHLTVRCDGNSEPNTAFGGPMYYGHSPDGYSQRNVFNFQTRRVHAVWDALSSQQRMQAKMTRNPGELAPSVRFRPAGERRPGLAAGDMTADQRRLVEDVMRDLIAPFRREDGDEVMDLIRRNGGLERLHLGFFRDANSRYPIGQWNFWRLEGPGFVWNYRVLEHVHCYVNIALQPQQPQQAAVRGV